ncbi:MAG: glycosyltransferase family 2 protein [Candidatus Pacebacteria bacterium]|nr:glycosyltransferase family 2 protein [Candidatus Paceibacterota bacterium]
MSGFSNGFIYVIIFFSLYFEIFLFITYLEKREVMKKEESKKNTKTLPSVSIIVPCYNEEKTIGKTLLSLLNLNYPKDKLQIIVINDGSTDSTAKVLKRFGRHRNVDIFHKENGGKYTALNFGLTQARGKLVGCLDADSFVEKDSLKKIAVYFEDKSVMSVVPSIIVHSPSNIIQFVQHAEYQWGIFLRKVLSYVGSLYVAPGPFSIFRRSVFEKIGNYTDGHCTEDLEIALRMQKHHYRILNAHNAFVHTVAPPTLKKLYRQRLRWTYGFLKNALDYRELFFKKEYGHLGSIVLPMAVITIFITLYYIITALWTVGEKTLEYVTRIQTVGLPALSLESFHFDLFFVNIDSILFLTLALFILTITLLLLGKRIAEGHWNVSKDVLYFLLLYPLIAPLWLLKAIYDVAFARKVQWR